ncbi:MAG: LysR family transcriptional regulator, partial [Pseudomonadota bacterium]
MQGHDWNDLRYLLALHRTGTLADAAQRTGVAETTVARRLKRLEQALGIPLFVKADQGRYRLTDPASAVLDHAEAMEAAHDALRERLGQISDTPGGPVRISSVPVLINRILAPAAADLDGLIVELIPEPRAVDLTKREADLALRFARPDAGGLSVKAQRIATLAFGVFAAAMIPEPGRGSLPWITYADSHGSLPQARWTEALRRAEAASPVVVCD